MSLASQGWSSKDTNQLVQFVCSDAAKKLPATLDAHAEG